MIVITATYDGDLRCTATHEPSRNTLFTDAPTDNLGKGQSFSPTDLVATALATCIMTTMAIAARREGFELGKVEARVEKHMVTSPTRRIGRLPARIVIHGRPDAEQRRTLEAAARGCPVYESIRPQIETPIEFEYPAL